MIRANFRASYTCAQILSFDWVAFAVKLVWCAPHVALESCTYLKLLFGAIRGLELTSYPRGTRRCRSLYSYIPRLNNLGTRPQERSSLGTASLTDCAQCMRMSSIDMGLDYDNTVMLTCKLLFAAGKSYSS